MTDREKLIELLESAESAVYWNSEDKTFIQKIADHLIANGVVISKNETTTRRWIPVTERLPDRNDMVIAFYPTMSGTSAEMQIHKAWVMGDTCTHWMPLPEMPKEE